MRIATSTLVLATVASLGSAVFSGEAGQTTSEPDLMTTTSVDSAAYSGVQNGLQAGQTTGDLQCKNAQKAFLACSLANDYNATTYNWIDAGAASCYGAAQAGLTGCRGGTALQISGNDGGFPTFAYPSYAITGGVTQAGPIKAQVLIPSPNLPFNPNSNKPNQPKLPKPAKNATSGLTKQNLLSPVTCKSCSKLLQKVLKCALPVIVPAQTDPFQAYFAAVDTCLTTAADRVLFKVCQPLAGSPLVPDANGQLSYLVAMSRLVLGDINEYCPSVEVSVTAKGGKSAKILKVPVGQNQQI